MVTALIDTYATNNWPYAANELINIQMDKDALRTLIANSYPSVGEVSGYIFNFNLAAYDAKIAEYAAADPAVLDLDMATFKSMVESFYAAP